MIFINSCPTTPASVCLRSRLPGAKLCLCASCPELPYRPGRYGKHRSPFPQHAGSYALALAVILAAWIWDPGKRRRRRIFYPPAVQSGSLSPGLEPAANHGRVNFAGGSLAAGLQRRALSPGPCFTCLFSFPGNPGSGGRCGKPVLAFGRHADAESMVLVTPAYNIYLLLGCLRFTAAVFSCLYC